MDKKSFPLLGAIALGASVLTGLLVALLPCTYASQSSSSEISSETGRFVTSQSCSSLLEYAASGVMAWLLVPVAFAVIAFLGLLTGKRVISIVAVSLLGFFCVVTGFSIGLFYFPTLVLAIVATATWRPRHG